MRKYKPQRRVFKTERETMRAFVRESALLEIVEGGVVLVGPVMKDGGGHFLVCCGECERFGFSTFILQVGPDESTAENCRGALLEELPRADEVQVFDDGVEFAEVCAERWPCEKTRALLSGVRGH
jgi:hypothetical protein